MWDLSSPTKNQTHIPCIGRQNLHHWATRQVPTDTYFNTAHIMSGFYPNEAQSIRDKNDNVAEGGEIE